jgi:hypothetical protein
VVARASRSVREPAEPDLVSVRVGEDGHAAMVTGLP